MRIETQQSLKHKMVELKARVDDHDFLRKKLSALGAEYTGTFQQSDLYFRVPEGRLKLRTVKDNNKAELIYYERESIAGPKSDDAFILRVQEPEDLKKGPQEDISASHCHREGQRNLSVSRNTDSFGHG